MKIIELFARDIKPIKLAHVQDLSDTIVIAGPNGVGKTRLINNLLQRFQTQPPQFDTNFYIRLLATNEEEKADWKKNELNTLDMADRNLLQSTLRKNRRRANFTSSFLHFESNRTIQNVQSFNWDWNFGDPFDEIIGWSIGLNGLTSRFQDTLHSIFRKIRSRREAIAIRVEELIKAREVALRDETTEAETREKLEREAIGIKPADFPRRRIFARRLVILI